jgi:N-acyl amino acid synthase of PEP-CTERM/exosortase system
MRSVRIAERTETTFTEGTTLTTTIGEIDSCRISSPSEALAPEAAFFALDGEFVLQLADSEVLMEQCYRLRHQVYCKEHHYEQPAGESRELETDAWDARSLQLLIRHRSTGFALATARLILGDEADPQQPFPAEFHAGIDPAGFANSAMFLPRHSIAEVSRFSISKAARSYLRDTGAIASEVSESDLSSWITLRLINGLVELSRKHSVAQWYTFMEGGFIRLLRRMGMRFEPVGTAIEFHGRRFVAIDSVDDLVSGMKKEQPELHGLMVAAALC